MNLSFRQRAFKQLTKLPAAIVRFLIRADGSPNGVHFYLPGRATKKDIAYFKKLMGKRRKKSSRRKRKNAS